MGESKVLPFLWEKSQMMAIIQREAVFKAFDKNMDDFQGQSEAFIPGGCK